MRSFLVYQPVMCEIFAADFRDRVIHHFVINRINPITAEEVFDNTLLIKIIV